MNIEPESLARHLPLQKSENDVTESFLALARSRKGNAVFDLSE